MFIKIFSGRYIRDESFIVNVFTSDLLFSIARSGATKSSGLYTFMQVIEIEYLLGSHSQGVTSSFGGQTLASTKPMKKMR